MSKQYNISLLPGDGTGPEVVDEAVKVLEKTSKDYEIDFVFTNNDLGGDRYLSTGELVTDKDIEQFKNSDAVLLGAIGHPDVKPGILEQGILLKLRKEFDQYINLRPVVLYPGVETPLANKNPEDINFVVVRENTEGLYAGAGGYIHYGTENEIATQESINSYYAIHRCIKYAFEYTKKVIVKKLHCVQKLMF
jgi:3-isopropylmalate dehydrogenase